MNGLCNNCKIDTEVYFVGEGDEQELLCKKCFKIDKCKVCGFIFGTQPAKYDLCDCMLADQKMLSGEYDV